MDFPTKNDHFGVVLGVPPFKETPICFPKDSGIFSRLERDLCRNNPMTFLDGIFSTTKTYDFSGGVLDSEGLVSGIP